LKQNFDYAEKILWKTEFLFFKKNNFFLAQKKKGKKERTPKWKNIHEL